MSLDRTQLAQTAADLRRNLALTGLATSDLAAWLGLAQDDVEGCLRLDDEPRSPVTVWLVRDAIDAAARTAGAEPAWSVLDAAARRKAQQWFPLRDVPARR